MPDAFAPGCGRSKGCEVASEGSDGDAVGLREVAGGVHPAGDAARAAAHGVADGDAAVDAGGVEGGVLARIPPAGYFLGQPHQREGIVGLEAFFDVARIGVHRLQFTLQNHRQTDPRPRLSRGREL